MHKNKITLVIAIIMIKNCLSIPAFLYLDSSTNNLIKNDEICIDSESGKKLLIGESFYSNNKCTQKQCIWGPSIWEYECNVPKFSALVDGECQQILQKDPIILNYPKCCPRYECKKYSGNYYEQNIYNHYGNLLSKSIVQVFSIAQYPQSSNNTNSSVANIAISNMS